MNNEIKRELEKVIRKDLKENFKIVIESKEEELEIADNLLGVFFETCIDVFNEHIKYGIQFHKSKSTESFYFILVDGCTRYCFRFSEHQTKVRYLKTFNMNCYSEKRVRKFIRSGIKRLQVKKVYILIDKVS